VSEVSKLVLVRTYALPAPIHRFGLPGYHLSIRWYIYKSYVSQPSRVDEVIYKTDVQRVIGVLDDGIRTVSDRVATNSERMYKRRHTHTDEEYGTSCEKQHTR